MGNRRNNKSFIFQSIDLKFDKEPFVTIRGKGAGMTPGLESNRHSETSMGSNE